MEVGGSSVVGDYAVGGGDSVDAIAVVVVLLLLMLMVLLFVVVRNITVIYLFLCSSMKFISCAYVKCVLHLDTSRLVSLLRFRSLHLNNCCILTNDGLRSIIR